MGWSHPDISLDDLLVLIKGFVDILILASGYQSSGLSASWDVENIKKAVRWGIFFEDGLAHMSSATLSKARDLILEHLVQTHPLEAAHITSLLTAIVELDIDNLTDTDNDGPNMYMDRLMLHLESHNLISVRQDMFKKSFASLPATGLKISDNVCNAGSPRKCYIESEECNFTDHSYFLIQELLKRQASISRVSSAERGLDTFLKIVTRDNIVRSENKALEEPLSNDISLKDWCRTCWVHGFQLGPGVLFSQSLLPHRTRVLSGKWSGRSAEMLSEFSLWDQWRSRCLSYLLDKRTITMLSGANLIFSASKVQWIRVFEPLKVSLDVNYDNLLEIMEISLLGFISSRWNSLIECFISQTYNFLPISKQYSDLQYLLQGNSLCAHSKKEAMNSKERDILEYVAPLLSSQPHKLWLLPPVLAAAAIPSWSILFRIYLNEIEKQFSGACSQIRYCGCNQKGKEHRVCEVAERIRCLYVVHIQSSHLLSDDFSA
ncbi:uncharacterized protein LOC103711847 isoform X2 [Phoenix dactylifera]|uniref:Uncharacterized protein LOC103711847 isoform X2 n=1 Tax=Phoenix dactylifera TaxID=42345 RepID=A0A8B8J744_PHODC|nr:uncharacterized protein LOC103711847 isoform X2 [Phoenix dactylifera]